MGIIWSTKEQEEKWKKKNQELWNYLMWGAPPDTRTEDEKYMDHLKLAWIINEKGEREMADVHNKNMKAYRMDFSDGYPTRTKKPLEEIHYQHFERWCTPFDL